MAVYSIISACRLHMRLYLKFSLLCVPVFSKPDNVGTGSFIWTVYINGTQGTS
jgi:hypothetical protein